jgi:hypothetical protein
MIKKAILTGMVSATLYAGTVVDSDTGLMWQDTSDIPKRTYSGAVSYCNSLTLGGYSDWRLPNIDELMSITNKNRFNPAVKNIFSYTKSSWYWSSTEYKGDSSDAWFVSFRNGYDYYGSKSDKNYVRCVRGRQ